MRRESILTPGFSHENPVPTASRIGGLLFTGVITGRDPETREMPSRLASQCANIFTHVRSVMTKAGAGTDAIAKMTFWLAAYRDREALNEEWVRMFPDARSRPARQCMAASLDRGSLIQCDLIAVLHS